MLATYIFLFIVALESILVYHIVEWHAKKQQAEVSSATRCCAVGMAALEAS